MGFAVAAWSRGLYLGDEAEEDRASLRSIVLAPSFYWPRHIIKFYDLIQTLINDCEATSVR